MDASKIALQGLRNDVQRLDVLSQNLVNANTPGYRRLALVARPFADVLSASHATATPLSVSVPQWQPITDERPGALQSTGRALDLALTGPGYFEVKTPDGLAYTRKGNFQIDPRGRLVTEQGYPVLGREGELLLGTGTPHIDASGRISVDGKPVGQLRVVQLDQASAALEELGHGLYGYSGTVEPLGNEAVSLSQGQLEGANTVARREMVELMATMRHFEAQTKLLQGYGEAMSSAIQEIGKF
ncbi:flagellar hook-basal body protein [Chitinimonas lacunae]|uniref:Flagellar hook-basal body protein n=1 Tax=Chitinimonas lacunae TaxID=1963018 RepID=A0ABV8MUE0_9NEIS